MFWYMWVSYHMVLVVSHWSLSMHRSLSTVYHRVQFADPYCFHSIPLPFPISLPTTTTLIFIFKLMYICAPNTSMLFQLLNNWTTVCLMFADWWPAPTNKQKLNPDKTELVFWLKVPVFKVGTILPVNTLGTLEKPADTVTNLGVWFDSELAFSRQDQVICKSCVI